MNRFRITRLAAVAIVLAALAGCETDPEIEAELERRRSPASVRGWIWDIDAPAPTAPGTLSVVDPALAESQRRQRLFEQSNIALENVQHASGGLTETGSFIILDAPPRAMTILFQTPLGDARLPITNIPPNADIYLPNVVITKSGASFAEPGALRVRIPGDQKAKTGQIVRIGEHRVEVEQVPIGELVDRRDFPAPQAPASVTGASPQPVQ